MSDFVNVAKVLAVSLVAIYLANNVDAVKKIVGPKAAG